MAEQTALRAFLRAGVPLLLVLASVVLLAAAAASSAFRLLPDHQELILFGAGGYAWIAGIAWGILWNGRVPRGRHA